MRQNNDAITINEQQIGISKHGEKVEEFCKNSRWMRKLNKVVTNNTKVEI